MIVFTSKDSKWLLINDEMHKRNPELTKHLKEGNYKMKMVTMSENEGIYCYEINLNHGRKMLEKEIRKFYCNPKS